ncbi:probable multidrug resistance-associated protein lethal(2)03659 isoform X2 [Zophobas morio]
MEDLERKNRTRPVKKIHPKARANLLSTLFFCWALPFFRKGLKKDLGDDDLYGPLKSHESRILGDRMKKAWENEENQHRIPSLRRIIVKVFYREIIFYSFFLLIQELVLKLGQPLLVGKLLEYYTPNGISKNEAYMYAAGIILFSFLNVMIVHGSYFGLEHLSIKMQIACRSLIYRKALKLSKTAMMESTVGQMVNLISTDVSRFHYICLHLYQIFVTPIQTMIALYLLFATVDATAMVGVGLLMLFIPILFYLGKLTARYRYRTALKSDYRIRLMNEIISGIQVIKMYTWEKPFAKLIELARKLEIHEIKANAYLRAIYMSTSMYIVPTSIFLCVLTYVSTGHVLQAHYVYVATSFYGTLRQPLTLHLPRCVAMLAEIGVSLKRIQSFLLNDEVDSHDPSTIPTPEVGISLQGVDVQWDKSSSDLNLSGIDFCVGPNQLVAVVGRVGSGKTTLIQTILKEASLSSGTLQVKGKMSYASQEPWLFASSIKQNILFGEDMDLERYKKVVRVCALEKDFMSFPYGDRTIVGEKGIMLSGGQKARVGLARAIYKQADIYLLDDPLSAVDVQVGKQIFEGCITGYLKDKCVVLVTHQIQYLSNVDKIYVLENGTISASGTYAELKKVEGDFIKLLHEVENEVLEEEDTSETSPVKRKSIGFEEKTDLPKEVKEQRGVGTISKKVYLHYFRMGGSYLFPLFVFTTFLLTQICASGVDYFLSFWVNLEQKRLEDQQTVNDTESYRVEFEESFFTSDNLLCLYGSLIALLIFLVLLRSVCFVKYSMMVAKRLHDYMFDKTVHTTMRFFNTNPSGRILNRFARDMNIVDETLPTSMTDSVQVFLHVLAITFIISLVNLWIILPTIVIFVIFYGYKFVFVSTSRDLKRIESTARSPLFSHLTASLQGLSTIRAFGAQKVLQLEFDHIQDHHSSAYFMFMSCSRTFGFWLDVNCVIYIGLVILSFLFIGTETYGGNVGLAITQSIALTGTLQRGIRQWSELENHMTSVERVVEYTELSPEPDLGKTTPPKNWPQQGKIDFIKVSMKYSVDSPYVLRTLSWTVAPKEKIGIVGRTGAGKSSLISALFRLALVEGTIKIDDIDTKSLPLTNLRSIMSIIPQEPVLFSGLLRKNLDPFDEYSDEELWNGLEEVELKQLVSDLPAGLSTKLAEGGSNFSVGERQL